MTNKEAIEMLEIELSYMQSHGGDRQAEALKMAIKSLETNNAVVHAKWIQQESLFGMTDYYECSECGRVIWLDKEVQDLDDFPYCHCGAKMDLEDVE